MDGHNLRMLIVRRMNPLLMPRGYARKNTNWDRHKGRVTTAVFMDFGTRHIVVQLGRFDRTVHRETHPERYVAKELVGMWALIPEHDGWNASRRYQEWTVESDADRLIELITVYGLPRLATFESA